MIKKIWIGLLSLVSLFSVCAATTTGISHLQDRDTISNQQTSAIDISELFPEGARDMGFYGIDNQPVEGDIISFLCAYVSANSPTNKHVINDLVVGTKSGTTTITIPITVKSTSTEYTGTFNVTYIVTNKTDLSTLGSPLAINFTSQPTNKQVLEAFVATNSSISMNWIDISPDATKTIVNNIAYSYEIVPSSFTSMVTGTVKIIVYKNNETINIDKIINNNYLSIFDTPTELVSDIQTKIKYWNDYYINESIANAMTIDSIGYDRIYEGHATCSLSSTYSFITGSIDVIWMYVPQFKRIFRGPNATATTEWQLLDCSSNSVSLTNYASGIDTFINNQNLTSYRAIGVNPIIRICDLTHTSVNNGNIGYNNGFPTQSDTGYTKCLYPQIDTDPSKLFHNHMNKSMKSIYLMGEQTGESRVAVFGDANLKEIWCKKPSGKVFCSCYNDPTSCRPPCNPSYIVHLPYGSTCTFEGTITLAYSNDTGADNNSAKNFMNSYPSIFPQYATNPTYYDGQPIDFQLVYDF